MRSIVTATLASYKHQALTINNVYYSLLLTKCLHTSSRQEPLLQYQQTLSQIECPILELKPMPKNEPIIDYNNVDKFKTQTKQLNETILSLLNNSSDEPIEVPIVIGGQKYKTEHVNYQLIPFKHRQKLAKFYYATPELISKAIETSLNAKTCWQVESIENRARVFERAALLASTTYRHKLNAVTIVGQAKTIAQSEIDAAAELVDFFNFNATFVRNLEIISQPLNSSNKVLGKNEVKNKIIFRPLDGFVASISPFNFTAIGANLASAPAMLANGVVWKPSDQSILANYVTFELMLEAGFPSGLINFVPASGELFGAQVAADSRLAAINFTGSAQTFRSIYASIANNVHLYNCFPRLVGETGGKNFHFVHNSVSATTTLTTNNTLNTPSTTINSSETKSITTAFVVDETIRSAFEYSGQKCSACSRLFVPQSLWELQMRNELLEACSKLKFGPANDPTVFSSAVIDERAFNKILSAVKEAKLFPANKLLLEGCFDNSQGYFITPTIFETKIPRLIKHSSITDANKLLEENKLFVNEIFGPVLIVCVYDDSCNNNDNDDIEELLLKLVASSSKFALTGSVFANDELFIEKAKQRLLMAAGNLYINRKSSGAIVGQQPFGGARLSGTNDKAGGIHYLMRWCNQQTVSELKL